MFLFSASSQQEWVLSLKSGDWYAVAPSQSMLSGKTARGQQQNMETDGWEKLLCNVKTNMSAVTCLSMKPTSIAVVLKFSTNWLPFFAIVLLIVSIALLFLSNMDLTLLIKSLLVVTSNKTKWGRITKWRQLPAISVTGTQHVNWISLSTPSLLVADVLTDSFCWLLHHVWIW